MPLGHQSCYLKSGAEICGHGFIWYQYALFGFSKLGQSPVKRGVGVTDDKGPLRVCERSRFKTIDHSASRVHFLIRAKQGLLKPGWGFYFERVAELLKLGNISRVFFV
jgi:hypothetical protein